MGFDISSASPVQAPPSLKLSPLASEQSNVEYFNSLPDHIKPMVNAVIEGRIPFAGRAPLDKKSMTQLMDVTYNVDPTADATKFAMRQKTANDFAAGLEGRAVKGANQALYHMGSLYKSVEDLNNTNILPGIINPIVNYIEKKGFGDTRQGTYQENATALASELRKVFAGQGGGSLSELNKWEESFDPNAGENQQKAYIKKGVELLTGGITALNEQYRKGMGLNKQRTQLDPEAQVIYEQLLQGKKPAPFVPDINTQEKPQTKAQKTGAALVAPVPVANDAEYNALKPGTKFVGPDKVVRTKPAE